MPSSRCGDEGGAEAGSTWTSLKLLLVAALLLAGAAQPLYFRILFRPAERSAWSERLTAARSGRLPGFAEYLTQISEHVHEGDRVALVVPYERWNGGYMYAYYRAAYALPECEVLPVLSATDQPLPQAFRIATHVAGWRIMPTNAEERFVWRSEDGFLLELRAADPRVEVRR